MEILFLLKEKRNTQTHLAYRIWGLHVRDCMELYLKLQPFLEWSELGVSL